jgi:hypothetical protein
MRPIGLTTKRCRNKYASERGGELMIIHQCAGCGTFVINRIAADDSAAALFEVFTQSADINTALHAELAASDVLMLTAGDSGLLHRRLFGDAGTRLP